MNKKVVFCNRCGQNIIRKDDLIVTNEFLSIKPYHYNCYCKEIKEQSIGLVGKFIINSSNFNISTFIACVAGVIMLFLKEIRLYSIIFFLLLVIKAYSFFKYEINIPVP